jgi:hypothetical protein
MGLGRLDSLLSPTQFQESILPPKLVHKYRLTAWCIPIRVISVLEIITIVRRNQSD